MLEILYATSSYKPWGEAEFYFDGDGKAVHFFSTRAWYDNCCALIVL